MDVGILGRRAIVCASSKGLGRACAEALPAEGVDVVINGRDAERLAATTAELRARYAAKVEAVVGDVTTDAGRRALCKRQIQTVAAKRLGRPEEFGATCAFVCGAYSGYLSAQNVHLDGGTYPALV